MADAVQKCFDHGADLVKTQLINYKTAWWAGTEAIKRYTEHESYGWGYRGWASGKIENFFEIMNAKHHDRVFASIFDTCFLSHDMLDIMPMWKLGYKAHYMPGLIGALCKVTVPVLASMTYADLDSDCFTNYIINGFHILQVTPRYPTLDHEQVLAVPCHGGFDGHSLHINNMNVLQASLTLRPEYMEIHVKVDGNGLGPDTEFAITLEQLKELSNFKGLING